ncbi:NucA/NucB deoxyribonuclease domain-containing protein [Paenibacillus tengchongensis]|uniref:NucA/NucB deoxyribonuclease domain-containing protein n=1 Tax=Paenibacillus tengchongensis TaxID=2608684 RepID=UPI00124E61DB|nr:NucA/NucB deoxyribonuclease domain-containing protein [Paenibacillus tengchongensis]
MKKHKWLSTIVLIALLVLAAYWFEENGVPAEPPVTDDTEVVQLIFPADRYPETADHIQEAINNGESPVCTIDRDNAEENRKESLKGVPTKKGFDRDEWPMAMCAEGGTGADIEYITPSDNRGAGSWVGNQLEDYANGTKVEFMFK